MISHSQRKKHQKPVGSLGAIIRPRTVLTLKKLWPHARKQGRELGQIWRVGYYSKRDGLEVVWLVDEKGEYQWTVDKDFVVEFFCVVSESKERSLYGLHRPPIGPLG